MKKLIFLIILLPVTGIAQTQTENHIKTTTYKVATTEVPSPTASQKTVNVTYFDGLGRPIQQIANAQSATGKNIVTPITYDDYGRQEKEYLPYATQTNGLDFVTTAITDQANFPDYSGQVSYSQKLFEASPLNRVLKQGAPGNSWALSANSNADHSIKFDYQTNAANEVKLYKAATAWNPANKVFDITLSQTGTAYYPEGQLYKTITRDENWTSGDDHTTQEFKDKEGRIVLKRTFGFSNMGRSELNVAHDTYYVYDQYGNLTYVIPPLVNNITTQLDELCYQYKYDYRNRLVEKKLPEKQWEYILYDKLDRVVATGPAFSPFTDQQANQTTTPIQGWMVTKYDAFNRVVYTGWQLEPAAFTPGLRASRQNTIMGLANLNETKVSSNTIDGTSVRYSNNTVLFSADFKLFTVNYYDDYDYPDAPTLPSSIESQPVYYNNSNKPKGLLTGSWVRITEASTTTPVKAETGYSIYDYKSRPIRNYTRNYLGGFTQVDTKYDFVKPLYTLTTHKRLSGSALITTKDEFAYTDQDRLFSHTHQINSAPKQLLVKNEYDELGQLRNKRVGGTDVTTFTGLQKVDYSYNIRGWLTGINKADGSPNPLQQGTDPLDLFAFKINYDTIENANDYDGQALYNGNIAETYWRTANDNILRKYGYQYDQLNRLKNAIYQKPGQATVVTDSYNESLSYDKNGNIKALLRYGDLDDPAAPMVIDDLVYTYAGSNSNRLVKVTDFTNNTGGFKDDSDGTNDTADDYSYDAHGNMTADQNKGIVSIKYNHLNLPTEVVFAGTNRKINYLYNATGVKAEKKVTLGSSVTITDYLGGYQYQKSGSGPVLLQFFPHAEGYVSNTVSGGNNVYNYIFNYSDHLGNNRLSYTLDAATNALTILEENNYYPFGLKHNNYNWDQTYYEGVQSGEIFLVFTPAMPFKYKYNGKEYQDELGLNMTAMDYRQYDNAIGRFVGMDRLSEFTHSITPYRFALNNPNYFNDPSGLSEFENTNEGLAHCPTCPNTPEFKPLIDDPNNTYYYDPETKQTSLLLEEVVIQGKPKASANSSTDYHDISMMFRKYSGYALTVQKPLGEAFASGTRYASQLYPSHTSNVVYQKSLLGKKIYVPLGNYNTATVGKISKALKITGRTLGVVAVGSGIYSIANDGLNISNGLDTTMAVLALSPTGVGQAIAGTYFLLNTVSQLTTGKDIGQHIQEQIDGE